MEPIAVVAALAGTFGAYIKWTSHNKRKREEQERAMAEERRIKLEEERDKVIKDAMEQLLLFAEWLTPAMVIDSNIWMNERYDSFFSCIRLACLIKKYRIELFGVQFDEISNIKKAAQYGDARNARARIAINRIEALQKDNFLRVIPITVDAKRGAYADPLIVKVLAQQSREGKKCTFFSDDKELRVRVRQHLSDYAEADWQIVEVENHLPTCEKILNGHRELWKRKQSEQAGSGNGG